MPLMYRVMLADNGSPKVGDERDCLGVRVPIDVKPDAEGIVHPKKRKGMSVSPRIEDFPPFLVPARLRDRLPGATNDNDDLFVWHMGEGPFAPGVIAPDFPNLLLCPDKPSHGTVGPAEPMLLDAFQQALADTKPYWRSIEDGQDNDGRLIPEIS